MREIERLVADLKGRMERTGEIYSGGGAKAAWFRDSEGNIMALIQSAY